MNPFDTFVSERPTYEYKWLIIWLTFQEITDYMTEQEMKDKADYMELECYDDFKYHKIEESKRVRCK